MREIKPLENIQPKIERDIELSESTKMKLTEASIECFEKLDKYFNQICKDYLIKESET